MTTKTLALVLLLAAVFLGGVLAMHGKGHAAVARWLPGLHGGSGH